MGNHLRWRYFILSFLRYVNLFLPERLSGFCLVTGDWESWRYDGALMEKTLPHLYWEIAGVGPGSSSL